MNSIEAHIDHLLAKYERHVSSTASYSEYCTEMIVDLKSLQATVNEEFVKITQHLENIDHNIEPNAPVVDLSSPELEVSKETMDYYQ